MTSLLDEKHVSSACDSTNPVAAEPRLGQWLKRSEENWHRDARYAVYASPPFNTGDPKLMMARWLPYALAVALAEQWNSVYEARFPRSDFCRLWFGIQLEMPASYPAGQANAQVGDLLIVQVTESTAHPNVERQFWLVSDVLEVESGRVVAYENRNGKHMGCPRKAVLVPMEQMSGRDVVKALLAAQASSCRMFGGEFSTPDHVLRVVRPGLRLPEHFRLPDPAFEEVLTRYSPNDAAGVSSQGIALAA